MTQPVLSAVTKVGSSETQAGVSSGPRSMTILAIEGLPKVQQKVNAFIEGLTVGQAYNVTCNGEQFTATLKEIGFNHDTQLKLLRFYPVLDQTKPTKVIRFQQGQKIELTIQEADADSTRRLQEMRTSLAISQTDTPHTSSRHISHRETTGRARVHLDTARVSQVDLNPNFNPATDVRYVSGVRTEGKDLTHGEKCKIYHVEKGQWLRINGQFVGTFLHQNAMYGPFQCEFGGQSCPVYTDGRNLIVRRMENETSASRTDSARPVTTARITSSMASEASLSGEKFTLLKTDFSESDKRVVAKLEKYIGRRFHVVQKLLSGLGDGPIEFDATLISAYVSDRWGCVYFEGNQNLDSFNGDIELTLLPEDKVSTEVVDSTRIYLKRGEDPEDKLTRGNTYDVYKEGDSRPVQRLTIVDWQYNIIGLTYEFELDSGATYMSGDDLIFEEVPESDIYH